MLIPTKFDVLQVSSGDFHSSVLDADGNIFTWGQNFKKQLGLFCKPGRLPETAMIEGVIMTPRIVPFSLKNSVRQISCGSTYTVAVSKAGDIWAFGSGECGQLGNGRCTVSEVPMITVPRISEEELFVSVACGFAHTLALTNKGSVFSWGLNHHGQLGIGDMKSRQTPQRVGNLNVVESIYASVHSTACIESSGQVSHYCRGVF